MEDNTAIEGILGVLDSGVGGLSLLGDIREQSPNHDIIYLADSRNIPFGDKPVDWICVRAISLCHKLIEMGAQLLVIACNTITCNCISVIREKVAIPVIGIEPALKPAALMKLGNKIAVLGTVGTLKSPRVQQLANENSQGEFIFYPCIGLADEIEKGNLESDEVTQLTTHYVSAAVTNGATVLVLGCTHYSLIKPLIQDLAGSGILIMEPSRAVARQVVRRTNTVTSKRDKPASLSVFTNGDISAMKNVLRRMNLKVSSVSKI